MSANKISTILDYLRLSWTILDYLRLSEPIQDYISLSQPIFDYISISLTISAYLSLSQLNSIYLSLFKWSLVVFKPKGGSRVWPCAANLVMYQNEITWTRFIFNLSSNRWSTAFTKILGVTGSENSMSAKN